MFKLEFFSLLKEIKNSQGEEKTKLLKSLNKLINENQDEYNSFVQHGLISNEMQEIISQAEELNQDNSNSEEQSDFQTIKNAYYKWLEEYKNSSDVTQNMAQIVQEIVNFYTPNRFETLKKILEVNDSKEYEYFKNHIYNTLRAHFANQIQQYVESDKYRELGFIQRLRKFREIKKLIGKINNYEFDKNYIKEVLK